MFEGIRFQWGLVLLKYIYSICLILLTSDKLIFLCYSSYKLAWLGVSTLKSSTGTGQSVTLCVLSLLTFGRWPLWHTTDGTCKSVHWRSLTGDPWVSLWRDDGRPVAPSEISWAAAENPIPILILISLSGWFHHKKGRKEDLFTLELSTLFQCK